MRGLQHRADTKVMTRSRLTTWPEIAAYIGRDARTAKRYEAGRGLPVRRVPGGGKAPVYAFSDELDAWLAQTSPEADPAPIPDAPPTPPVVLEPSRPPGLGRPLTVAIGTGLALIAAVCGAVVLGRLAPTSPHHRPIPRAVALVQMGDYAWRRRTPDGLSRAVDAFTQAAVIDPAYAPAYVGLADVYNLSPQYGVMAPADAFPRAKAAAERALALDAGSAAAHRALAFVDFWWAQCVGDAFREFHTALRLDPRSAQTHHWFANALAERGDPAAVAEIDAAVAAEPTTAAMADKGWILIMLGRLTEAQAVLASVTALDPSYATAHEQLAFLHERRGEDAEMLREDATVALLDHKPEQARKIGIGQSALARGGHTAMLRALADQEQGSLVQIASLRSRLRDRAATLRLLDAARTSHDPGLLGVATSPDFAWLRMDPRFTQLALIR